MTATADPSGTLAMQLRDAATAISLDDDSAEPEAPNKPERYRWAMFPARIHGILPLLCPRCGHAIRLVAFITDPVKIRHVLAHVGSRCGLPLFPLHRLHLRVSCSGIRAVAKCPRSSRSYASLLNGGSSRSSLTKTKRDKGDGKGL